jgi:phosphoglycolate phosphatase-like HAD superfamily hydrolase
MALPYRFNAIVFDFDGVLADSVDVKGDAFVALYADEGPEIQSQVLAWHRAHGGVTRHDKIRHYEKVLLGRSGSDADVEAKAQRFSTLVEQAVVDAAWVAGAREFLQHHAGKIPMFVASATPQDELIRIVEKRGMSSYFTRVLGAPKKKAEHLGDIMSEYGRQPAELLMVGGRDYRL